MFNKEEKSQIALAIERAELQTSGEIRVVVDKNCEENALDAAWNCFENLNMHQTRLHNGVLIYIAYKDRKFAIVGDKGINSKVSADFWNSTKELILKHFKAGQFTKGIIEGVTEAGKQLKKYFPMMHDDINELPNEVLILEDNNTSE